MTLATTEREHLATLASAEAQAALASGDTERARQKHQEAGAILAQEASDSAEKDLFFFLAATQYYKGGHYPEALDLAEKVKCPDLPAGTQPLFNSFLKDARDRASAGYRAGIRSHLQTLLAARTYPEILDVLREHPFVLPSGDLAFLRAVCCESLGKYRLAARFFADAVRRSPEDAEVLLALATPMRLQAQGRVSEAWEYALVQLQALPNAVNYAVASLLCPAQSRPNAEGNGAPSREEQQRYLERAAQLHAQMPPELRSHPEIKFLLALANAEENARSTGRATLAGMVDKAIGSRLRRFALAEGAEVNTQAEV